MGKNTICIGVDYKSLMTEKLGFPNQKMKFSASKKALFELLAQPLNKFTDEAHFPFSKANTD